MQPLTSSGSWPCLVSGDRHDPASFHSLTSGDSISRSLLLPLRHALVLAEKREDPGQVLERYGHVIAARDLDVLVSHAELLHLLGPRANALDLYEPVRVALDEDDRDVLDLLQL